MLWKDVIVYCLLGVLFALLIFMFYTHESELLACNEHWQVEMTACVCDPSKQVYKPLDIPEIYRKENVTINIS